MTPTHPAPELTTPAPELDAAEDQIGSTPHQALTQIDRFRATLTTDSPSDLVIRSLRLRGLAQHFTEQHTEGQQTLYAALAQLPPGDRAERVRLLCALARGAGMFGARDDELQWAREASEVARRLAENELIQLTDLALGLALSHCDEPQASLELFQQVLDADTLAVGHRLPALLGLGKALRRVSRLDESATCLVSALADADAVRDASRRASVQSSLGETLLALGRLPEARDMLMHAAETLQAAGRRMPEARARLRLGRVLQAQGVADAALAEFEQSLRMASHGGASDVLADAHQALSALHKSQGHFEPALTHLEAAVAASRARFNAESNRRFLALRVKTEVTEAHRAALAIELKHAKLATEHAELQARNLQLVATHAQQSAQLARLSEQRLRERSEMLDVLAHEVRQPLNNASAALQGVARALNELSNDAAAAPLRQAQAVMDNVVGAIDNTLAAASLLAGRQGIQLIDTDIDVVIAMTLVEFQASERARIKVERLTATRTVAMDMGLIRLALRNLLTNAFRHGPSEGAVTIRLSDSDEPLALFIDVCDKGPGFAGAALPLPVQRQSATGRRAGLGLYIVRRVMELHGGTVELVQSSRTGSTVRLVLPASAQP